MDSKDLQILAILQEDATVPLEKIAERIGLSPTPCWRRIQKLEAERVIRKRVVLLDPAKLNVGVTVFVAVKTSQHSTEWLARFSRAVADIPEVLDVYRMSGEVDYMLRIVVPDIAAYDGVYKRLIQRVPLADVTSMFAMEEMKSTTAFPLDYVAPRRP